MTRSILITGCSSGIGLDAARSLSARGWQVFASCRNPQDCASLRTEGFNSPYLDYDEPDSIAGALETVLGATGGRLDALFNNGAFALPGALEDLPRDGLRAIFETNLFGVHDLTRRVIPVMRAQGGGRIVMNSSVLGFVPSKWRGAYVASKYALEGLTDVLRMELADGSGIKVALIEPGPIDTPFRSKARLAFERWIDWEASPRAAQYRDVLIPRLYSEPKRDLFQRPPSAVSDRLIHALESPRPKSRYFVTTTTWIACFLRRFLPTFLLDRVIARS